MPAVSTVRPLAVKRRLAAALGALAAAATLGFGPAPAAAQDREPVVLGLVTALSGAQAQYGQDYLKIAELFAEQQNAAGGIDGREVSVISADTQEQPDIAISSARRLVRDQGATALLGHSGAGLTLAVSKALKSTEVPILLNYIWGNDSTGPDLPSVYRVGPYNAYVAMLMADYLAGTDYEDVVIFAEDTAYGTDFAESLVEAVGDEVAAEVIPFQAEIQDLSPVLGELAARPEEPDAIIVAGNYQIIYSLQNQIPAAGLESQIIGAWDYPSTPEFWQTAGENGVGIVYATFSGPSVELTPTGEAFRSVYAERFGRDPLFYEYFLWDCLNAVRQAVTDSGSVEAAALTEALAAVEFEGTTQPIRFTRDEARGIYNQALAGTLFMKRLTALNQADADAEVVATVAP